MEDSARSVSPGKKNGTGDERECRDDAPRHKARRHPPIQGLRGHHSRLQPLIRRVQNPIDVGSDGLHGDPAGIGVHDG